LQLDLSAARRDAESKAALVRAHENTLAQLRGEVAKLGSQLEASEKHGEQGKHLIETVQRELAIRISEVAEKDHAISELGRIVEGLRAAPTQADELSRGAELQGVRLQLITKEGLIGELQAQISSLQAQMQLQRHREDDLARQLTLAKEQVALKESSLETMKEKYGRELSAWLSLENKQQLQIAALWKKLDVAHAGLQDPARHREALGLTQALAAERQQKAVLEKSLVERETALLDVQQALASTQSLFEEVKMEAHSLRLQLAQRREGNTGPSPPRNSTTQVCS
jgi:chromosome segregation ATPase